MSSFSVKRYEEGGVVTSDDPEDPDADGLDAGVGPLLDVKDPAEINKYFAEQYAAQAKSQLTNSALIDQAKANLKRQRAPSVWGALSEASSQPKRLPGMSGTLASISSGLRAYNSDKAAFEQARADKELAYGLKTSELEGTNAERLSAIRLRQIQAAAAIKKADAAEAAATARANAPRLLGTGSDEKGPYTQWQMPGGPIVVQRGNGMLPPVVTPSVSEVPTTDPSKAPPTGIPKAPPTGIPKAPPTPAVVQAPRPAGLPPEAYKGPDNAWYISTYYGPKKATEASPEDLADAEALKKGATLRAETRVKAVAALPKLNEFATSALEDVRSLTQHPGLSSISGINFDIWNRLGNVNETDEQTGRVTIRPNVVPGSKAAGALTLYDKIKGGTFVTGFQETFKGTGAGAFSNIEGNKTEINQAAIDLRQSDAEFIKNANIYSASIIRDARLAQWAAGVPMTFGLPPRNPAALKLGSVYLTATDKPLVVKRDAKTGAPVLDWLNEEDRPKKAK